MVIVGDRTKAASDILSYRGIDIVKVNGLAGADAFLSNDTVVYTVIDMGSGDDDISIATVPLKPDTGNRTLEFPDGVPFELSLGNATLFHSIKAQLAPR